MLTMWIALAWAMLLNADAVVQVPVANMFSAPSEDADVVSQAFYSTTVRIVEQRALWAKVRTPDDYQGWTLAKHLRRGAPSPPPQRTATVRNLFAHLYREPSVTRHAPLLTVPFESALDVLTEPPPDRRWLPVRLVDGRPAWVQRGDLEFAPAPLTIPQMLTLAREFLGLPYTWGGTTSFGYDCSGFTQMLCRRRGVVLPRDADIQAAWKGLRDVPRDAVEPGDLLFFGPSPQKITHTGMVLGNGEFIHATVQGRPVIQVSKIAGPHWTRLLQCARRPRDNW